MTNNYAYERFKNRHEEKRYSESISKATVKCKCGHSIVMPNAERTICTWCGEWVYKNHKIEFKYNLKRAMILERSK